MQQTSPKARLGNVKSHIAPSAILIPLLGLLSCSPPGHRGPVWYKGNLHTHSLWSDGDDFPEMVVDWYRRSGYDFVAISDHNTLAEGVRRRWSHELKPGILSKYLDRFGPEWVEYEVAAGDTLVRLKTLDEFRPILERDGEFLILQSEEITDVFESTPVHVNATNLDSVIQPQGGSSIRDVMQRDVDAVLAQRRATDRPMLPHINHPNYQWALTAEDIAAVVGENFFEVYNGLPTANNRGDSTRLDTDRMWDAILTDRLVHGHNPVYALAVDDAHHYLGWSPDMANPGRGWIQVRSRSLTADSLISAMERGDFYASTGVVLKDIRFALESLTIEIAAEEGVSYRTEFIGTVMPAPENALVESTHADGPSEIETGRLLGTVDGAQASYSFAGNELYVRARVVSSRRKVNAVHSDEMETAWTQPVLP